MGGCLIISLSLVGCRAVDDVILCGSDWWLRSGACQIFVFLTNNVLLHGQESG